MIQLSEITQISMVPSKTSKFIDMQDAVLINSVYLFNAFIVKYSLLK